MYDFSNKVVLVTGGNGNLGQTVVKAFGKAGATLIVPDRSAGRLATLFPELAESDKHYLAEGVDVSQEVGINQLVSDIRQRFGRVDVLVNTVGGWEGMKLIHETSLETWDNMMNINGRIVFNICRGVLPLMLEQEAGKIINIGARQSLILSEKEAVFAASKSALVDCNINLVIIELLFLNSTYTKHVGKDLYYRLLSPSDRNHVGGI